MQMLEIGAIKLPELQGQHKSLQNQIQDMQCQKQELEREFQVINNRIIQVADVEKMHQQNFDTLADNIYDLQNQKHQLEQFIYRFKKSNKKYLKIKSIAEEVVNRLLREQETLLELALNAVIEALRMNPDKYKIIYDSKYDNNESVFDSSSTNTAAAISPPYTSSTSTKPYQNRYYNKYHEGILELAKGFLKILLNQLVDKTMVAAIKENESA
ncbi:MAG TPA: hypothetical protein VFJ51_14495 [Nitrososphaeraceae archaeon]|nr:hypothetical protein [Nitrososphaeraceae archaeon]